MPTSLGNSRIFLSRCLISLIGTEGIRLSKKQKLKGIAASNGESIEEMIPRVVKEEGSATRAAQRLGVAPNAIRYWLKKLGYQARFNEPVTWEKAEKGGDG